MIDHVALRRNLRIKFRTNTIDPPRALSVRADASQLELGQEPRECRALAQGIPLVPMQVQDPEARLGRRLVDIGQFPCDDLSNPLTVHHPRLRVRANPIFPPTALWCSMLSFHSYITTSNGRMEIFL